MKIGKGEKDARKNTTTITALGADLILRTGGGGGGVGGWVKDDMKRWGGGGRGVFMLSMSAPR